MAHHRLVGDRMYVTCSIHTGAYGRVPDPSHPAEHSFTMAEVGLMLWFLSAEDWEDGPRCLVDVLKSVEEYGQN